MDRDIPIRISVGNINSNIVGSITRSPDMRAALAQFFRAFADEIEGDTDESTNQTEQTGRQGTPEVE